MTTQQFTNRRALLAKRPQICNYFGNLKSKNQMKMLFQSSNFTFCDSCAWASGAIGCLRSLLTIEDASWTSWKAQSLLIVATTWSLSIQARFSRTYSPSSAGFSVIATPNEPVSLSRPWIKNSKNLVSHCKFAGFLSARLVDCTCILDIWVEIANPKMKIICV